MAIQIEHNKSSHSDENSVASQGKKKIPIESHSNSPLQDLISQERTKEEQCNTNDSIFEMIPSGKMVKGGIMKRPLDRRLLFGICVLCRIWQKNGMMTKKLQTYSD